MEFAGNLVPILQSGDQPQLGFKAFRENRLAFNMRLRDQVGITIILYLCIKFRSLNDCPNFCFLNFFFIIMNCNTDLIKWFVLVRVIVNPNR